MFKDLFEAVCIINCPVISLRLSSMIYEIVPNTSSNLRKEQKGGQLVRSVCWLIVGKWWKCVGIITGPHTTSVQLLSEGFYL